MDYTKIFAQLMTMGPLGYVFAGLLTIALVYMGIKKKKAKEERDRRDAGAAAGTIASGDADQISQGRDEADDFLGRNRH